MELNYNYHGPWHGGANYNIFHEPTYYQRQSFPTPLSPGSHQSQAQGEESLSPPVVYVKVFSPQNKKDFTMYTLRRFVSDELITPEDVKEAVFSEVGETVVSQRLDFQVGYFSKSNKLWLNNTQDVQAALTLLKRNRKLILWCMGIDLAKRKRSSNDAYSDDEVEGQSIPQKKRKVSSASEEKASRVVELKRDLREKHGAKYSMVQYALWAEMIVGGTHEGIDEPPPVPMFNTQRPRGKANSSGLADTLNTVADKIVTALAPVPNSVSSPAGVSSPVKNVEIRGKYIQQLKDLVDLRNIGALNDEEYEEQRLLIVNLMRNLGK